jgi:hypothetical protein
MTGDGDYLFMALPYNGTVKTVKYFYNILSRIEKKGKEGCNDSKAKI